MLADPAVSSGKQQSTEREKSAPVEPWIQTFAMTAAAAGLTIGGSFLNFLNYNGYKVCVAEVGMVFAAIAAFAILIAFCAAEIRKFSRVFIPTILVCIAIDLNVDSDWLMAFGMVAMFFAAFSRLALITIFATVSICQVWLAIVGSAEAGATTFFDNSNMGATFSAAKPGFALIHLILDEHIGIEGIPDSHPRGREIRQKLRDFYLGRNFRIVAGAYSENLHTINAVSRAFGLDTPITLKHVGRHKVTLENNPYFDALQSMGFSIDVMQTDFINFCAHGAVARCTTRAAGSLVDVGDRLPRQDKAAILIYRFLALSNLGTVSLAIYDELARLGPWFGYELPLVELTKRTQTSALVGMASFDDVIEWARSLETGRAIFAHILLPHYPYAYDESCSLRRVSEWLGRGSSAAWRLRYDAYFDQLTCVTSKVEELLRSLSTSPATGKIVVIVHGDHGSRIVEVEPSIENEGIYSERDLVDGHATFFAVSAPSIAPGYDSGRYPLRLILKALARSRFKIAAPDLPDGFRPTIAVEDRRQNAIAERPVDALDWWKEGAAKP